MAHALYWKSIYEDTDAQSLVYRLRRDAVIDLIDGLALPAGSRILEIGCGAGSTAVELARQGYCVEAVDVVPAMLQMTRQRAAEARVELRTCLAAAERLPYKDESFDLVLAVGLIPWLPQPDDTLVEMGRVLKPAAALVITANNRWRLQRILDPLAAARRLAGRILRRAGLLRKSVLATMHSPVQIDRMLSRCGFLKVKARTVGFGPFTVFGCRALPNTADLALEKRLLRAANSKLPFISLLGSHYITLARKADVPTRAGELREHSLAATASANLP